MEMKQCPQCKNVMVYNNYYHMFQCNCGKTYNYNIQELLPLELWKGEYDNEE